MALSTTASAKTTAIDINGTDGKVYEYNYASLKTSALACILNGANDPGAKLYNDFMTRNKTISAFYDDTREAYVDFNTVSSKAVSCAISGQSFNLDNFLDDTSTPTITVTPSEVTVDGSGNISVGSNTAITVTNIN